MIFRPMMRLQLPENPGCGTKWNKWMPMVLPGEVVQLVLPPVVQLFQLIFMNVK
jgi:hypothetical protein